MRSMGERYQRPDWVRRVNAMGPAAGSPASVVPIGAGELIDQARRTTGIDDFADLGDGDWEQRLRALVGAIEHADLHVVGRLMTREELLRCLRVRLQLGAERTRDPSVAEEQITAPVVITGPARSGTTILFELLALDEGFRSPIAADVMHPAAEVGSAERLAMTEAEQEFWSDVQPEFASIHELRADLPVECITICAPSFAGSHWSMVLDDPGAWMPDPATDFAFHKAVLQSVQHRAARASGRRASRASGRRASRASGRRASRASRHSETQRQWLLKTPAYIFLLDDLLTAYPDASIVFTHRDPAKTMPSTASTTAMIRWLRSDNVNIGQLSELVGLLFTAGLSTVAERHHAGTLPKQTGHVRFADLMSDPAIAIETAYEGIGRELTAKHRDAVLRYLEAKPRAKHGTHDYTAEEWGYDPETLRRDLASYMSTFGVDPES